MHSPLSVALDFTVGVAIWQQILYHDFMILSRFIVMLVLHFFLSSADKIISLL